MPRDPKRNIDRYKISGGHVNEFEFHKHQEEMAEEFEAPANEKSAPKPLTQAERVALVTAEAHRKVEKRKKRLAKAGSSQKNAQVSSSAGKTVRKGTASVDKTSAAKAGAKTKAAKPATKKASKKATKKATKKAVKK